MKCCFKYGEMITPAEDARPVLKAGYTQSLIIPGDYNSEYVLYFTLPNGEEVKRFPEKDPEENAVILIVDNELITRRGVLKLEVDENAFGMTAVKKYEFTVRA